MAADRGDGASVADAEERPSTCMRVDSAEVSTSYAHTQLALRCRRPQPGGIHDQILRAARQRKIQVQGGDASPASEPHRTPSPPPHPTLPSLQGP